MIKSKKRRFESLNNDDKRKAVAKFFGINPSEIEVASVTGYDGPVTQAIIGENEFWILSEDEAYREATESFLNTGFRGADIERDSYLNMAARNCPFDLDAVAEYYCDYMNDVDDEGDERSYDEIREDEYALEQWAEDTFSIEDLWDNDLIDKEQFCCNIWDMDGIGMELDMEQRTESTVFNGETLYIVLRDGEWPDVANESKRPAVKARKRRVETKTRKVCSIPCILKSNRRRHFEDATDELSDAVDVIEGKDKFDARAFKFEVRSGNSNEMIKNGKFVGKLSANLTMRYEGAECSVSVTDTKSEMTVDEMPDVTTSLYAVTVQLPTNRRDMTIEREGDGYVIHIAADCNVDCPETMKSLSALCYCHFTFHVTNKRTVGKMSAWILEGVDDSVKKKRGGGRRRASSLAGMLDLDMFADGTTYDDLEYALSSGDYSYLL